MGGLPLVGVPVVLAVWLSHGADYAQPAALAAPVGLWANIVYMLVVGWSSARLALVRGDSVRLGQLPRRRAADRSRRSGVIAGLGPDRLACAAGSPPATCCRGRKRCRHARICRRSNCSREWPPRRRLVLTLTTVSERPGPATDRHPVRRAGAAVVIPAFTFATVGRDALAARAARFPHRPHGVWRVLPDPPVTRWARWA